MMVATFLLSAVLTAHADKTTFAPPKEVSALVAPVLNAHDAVFVRGDESSEKPLEAALENVLRVKTGYGDEALTIILGLSLAKHPAKKFRAN